MQLFDTAIGAILPLFGLVLLGYLGKKLRMLQEGDAQVLSRFVVELALPALIIDAFVHNPFNRTYFVLPVTVWLSTAVSLGAVILACAIIKAKPQTTGAMLLVTCFGNTGYMGYPITTAIRPNLLPAAVICDQIGMAMLLYPFVTVLGSIYGKSEGATITAGLAKFARSPLLMALVAGLIIALAPPLHRPADGAALAAYVGLEAVLHWLVAVVHTLAAACIPVILIAIGLLLRPSTLRTHIREVSIIGVLKLVVAPVVAWAAAKYLLGLHGDLLTICVLESAVPSSAAATVLAGQYDLDGSLAVAAFFALTIASAVTIPLALTLLR